MTEGDGTEAPFWESNECDFSSLSERVEGFTQLGQRGRRHTWEKPHMRLCTIKEDHRWPVTLSKTCVVNDTVWLVRMPIQVTRERLRHFIPGQNHTLVQTHVPDARVEKIDQLECQKICEDDHETFRIMQCLGYFILALRPVETVFPKQGL